jgi:predicted amidophosphoribosyltransferase
MGRSTSGSWLGRWIAEGSDAIVSVLFPADCRLCRKLLTRATRVPICDECLASFVPMPERVCELCGAALGASFLLEAAQTASPDDGSQPHTCAACSVRTYAFDRARSHAKYDAALIRALVMLKFERIDPLGAGFADRLAEVARREGETLAADVVVPVPVHRQRERERIQPGRPDRQTACPSGLGAWAPIPRDLLVRKRPRPDTQVLSLTERWESVRGAFATRPGSQVDNLRVLLVDDVMTTGATLDACARAPRESGAKSVVGLTVARAARHPVRGFDES